MSHCMNGNERNKEVNKSRKTNNFIFGKGIKLKRVPTDDVSISILIFFRTGTCSTKKVTGLQSCVSTDSQSKSELCFFMF